MYFAAMSFSTFYHTCDEATSSYADFPAILDDICARLFVDHQVLQVSMSPKQMLMYFFLPNKNSSNIKTKNNIVSS